MATIQQLVGRWRLVESKGFHEYMKEVGVGMALRKVGAMAKPDCIISSDGKNLTIKTESTLKTTQFSCNLGEKFEETTANGRRTQAVCNFTDSALVQHQEWDGKESTITRKLENGKSVVECVMNNVTYIQVYEKVKIPSSFWTGISYEDEQAQFNEQISILLFFSLLCSIIFIINILHASISKC
ncbi:fatty acid-binding protein 5-like [Zalophus californianus]|uniref:Fatty acid-binding protein 5-like n=1 Tax=Zalophus californianus TaxID=9704 RepID=A0A6P9EWY5_ZALCA|nr:fatty acid-binding protein 5-like [Zalophus californianus]